ncbi:unnamed protein product [Dovyalis caffra]|uniref:Uncharacterized protein n=1 Tax=Dovyalis caffra TaxID=77055 RepID=A0AAV1SPA8_9ROSI|nr:unnamed protein product [Dovyalis caffra]
MASVISHKSKYCLKRVNGPISSKFERFVGRMRRLCFIIPLWKACNLSCILKQYIRRKLVHASYRSRSPFQD